MTNEEIEAARKLIISGFPVASWTHKALDALNSLCEAAMAAQPESLVGRRVRHKKNPDWKGTISEINKPYHIYLGRCQSLDLNRAEFELIEPTGEKGGD